MKAAALPPPWAAEDKLSSRLGSERAPVVALVRDVVCIPLRIGSGLRRGLSLKGHGSSADRAWLLPSAMPPDQHAHGKTGVGARASQRGGLWYLHRR